MQTTKPITKEITVTVGGRDRRFLLKRLTVKQALEHIEASEDAWNRARAAATDAMGDDLQMTMSSRAYLEAIQPTIVALLATPADEGEPLTAEEFWLLDSHEPANVLAAQEDYAQLQGILANARLLIQDSQRDILDATTKASEDLLSQLQAEAVTSGH